MSAPAPQTSEVQASARELSDAVLRPGAKEIDRERRFPSENFDALASAGLLGILVPRDYGGLGGSLTEFALVAEELGRGCASTAMCFLMHGCGCALIASRATPEQGDRWLRPGATGEAIATLAFSERGTGAHFYQPEIKAERRDGAFVVSGRKTFVTSGGHAHIYPVLTNGSGDDGLDVLVVTGDMPGISFQGAWEGIGMAGNSSVAMALDNVAVPQPNLLGAEGEGQSLVFDVVAPTFLIGLAAVNVGIAQAALDTTADHARSRKYPDGQTLAEVPAVQTYLADMGIATQGARQLLKEAARAADAGEEAALALVMQAKVKATESAQDVTAKAMQVGGGLAYSRRLPLERHWRDARAGSVMAPTNDVLKDWLGKIHTGLPLFE